MLGLTQVTLNLNTCLTLPGVLIPDTESPSGDIPAHWPSRCRSSLTAKENAEMSGDGKGCSDGRRAVRRRVPT